MVAAPSVTPVTWPLLLTVAMAGLELVHVTALLLTVQGQTVAVSCTALPGKVRVCVRSSSTLVT